MTDVRLLINGSIYGGNYNTHLGGLLVLGTWGYTSVVQGDLGVIPCDPPMVRHPGIGAILSLVAHKHY